MRWEYKTVIIKYGMFSAAEKQAKEIDEQLNQEGMLGWELVTYVMIGSSYRAIFKRQK
jgi:hypothetical protein